MLNVELCRFVFTDANFKKNQFLLTKLCFLENVTFQLFKCSFASNNFSEAVLFHNRGLNRYFFVL